jgi:hypothetical protein
VISKRSLTGATIVPVPSAAGTIDCACTKVGKRKLEKETTKPILVDKFLNIFFFSPTLEWGPPSGLKVVLLEGFTTSQ